MKKLLSILSALLILVSGMHFTMSAHICAGQVSAVRWSFGGENASCGMHEYELPDSETVVLNMDCCHNTVMTVTVDENYSPSSFIHLPELSSSAFSFNFLLPVNPSPENSVNNVETGQLVFPEKDLLAGGMSLSGLCIFRI